jgi:hypothetical protein
MLRTGDLVQLSWSYAWNTPGKYHAIGIVMHAGIVYSEVKIISDNSPFPAGKVFSFGPDEVMLLIKCYSMLSEIVEHEGGSAGLDPDAEVLTV